MRPWLLALTFAVACEPRVEGEPTTPVVRIVGSQAELIGLTRLVETHTDTLGTLRFEVRPDTDSGAMRALLAGEADIAAVGRRHLPAEQEQARANGYSLEDPAARTILAVDVVAVATHPDNPIASLTYDQIIGIWCGGTIDNWSFLGLDDAPVRALTPEPMSGRRALFEDFFCGPPGMHRRVEVHSDDEIARILVEDPNAIAYVSLAQAAGKVLGLRPDATGPALLPSQQNVSRGSYPLYHDLYAYTAGPAEGPEAAFLTWVGSPAGQEVIDESRYVPLFLRPERSDESRPLRETIHFERGSSEPNQRSVARIDLLVDELEARAGEYRHVVLEGYADAHEPDAMVLSHKRADAVKGILEKRLPGLFFEIIPRGSTQPIAPNETPYGRQRNRRVQIYLGEEEKGGTVGATDRDVPAGP